MKEEPILATDKLDEIQRGVDYLRGELEDEALSYSEAMAIDELYELVKEYI